MLLPHRAGAVGMNPYFFHSFVKYFTTINTNRLHLIMGYRDTTDVVCSTDLKMMRLIICIRSRIFIIPLSSFSNISKHQLRCVLPRFHFYLPTLQLWGTSGAGSPKTVPPPKYPVKAVYSVP